MMMVSRFSTHLIGDKDVEVHSRMIMSVNNGEIVQFPIERKEDCLFCKV